LKTQVGGDHLDVRLEDWEQREAAVAALAAIAGGSPAMVDGTLSVPLRDRRGAIADAVRRLDEAGVAIDDLAVRRATLDDVFLKLTGRTAEDGADEHVPEGKKRGRR
jgi:ABC-2 type transport system ATP-binding protein